MNTQAWVAALGLPLAARVDRRVPKTLLLEHGAVTAADKRRIKDGIERIQWLAALKPGNTGIASHRDGDRDYAEIAVLQLDIRCGTAWPRLVELLHRAIPYPTFIMVSEPHAAGSKEIEPLVTTHLSLAHQRQSLGDKHKIVLDGDVLTVQAPEAREVHTAAFAEALALAKQPQADLLALYQGWMDTLLALKAARQTGQFACLASAQKRKARAEALAACERLDATITQLQTAAKKETQMARRVELNLELQQAQAERRAAEQQL